jgi:hypothetical protein
MMSSPTLPASGQAGRSNESSEFAGTIFRLKNLKIVQFWNDGPKFATMSPCFSKSISKFPDF